MALKHLYIHKDVANQPLVEVIKTRLTIPFTIVDDAQQVYQILSTGDDPIGGGKKSLFLTRNKGAFIRSCPGTSHYQCCGYKILHIGTFCPMDCSYCILQAYFHPPILQYFLNHTALLAELRQVFARPEISRIGTGEFTDSLIWELWTDTVSYLVPEFANQSRAILELKTKTIAVDALADLKHNQKTVIAWSLNTESVIKSEERATAPLAARLQAAAKCQLWGYPLAFHFDPIVLYPGCESDYQQVIQSLFKSIAPESIVWISLGMFRFMPALKPIIQMRFPQSKIIYGEFVPGLDGKMRYFKPLRIKFYQQIVSWIKDMAPDVQVYFCMEDDEIWQKTIGITPGELGGLAAMLDRSAARHCNLIAD